MLWFKEPLLEVVLHLGNPLYIVSGPETPLAEHVGPLAIIGMDVLKVDIVLNIDIIPRAELADINKNQLI